MIRLTPEQFFFAAMVTPLTLIVIAWLWYYLRQWRPWQSKPPRQIFRCHACRRVYTSAGGETPPPPCPNCGITNPPLRV